MVVGESKGIVGVMEWKLGISLSNTGENHCKLGENLLFLGERVTDIRIRTVKTG